METASKASVIYNASGKGSPSSDPEAQQPQQQLLQLCVVCGDVSDGPHFGAVACRACAAFFRRTVSLKLEYTCRANSNCQIDKCGFVIIVSCSKMSRKRGSYF